MDFLKELNAAPEPPAVIVITAYGSERVAIEAYSQIISLIGDKDSTTRRLLEDILSDEQEHAEELKGSLASD